ncbi:MAG TPA: hypothetical protein DIU15_18655 [Deltaproteobacteria bacterium]|nr:hypothetical protein [Deltaproteobacteria bacterium]HCP48067.1 hypothetical protein [Deltaproteobacteria bacterium]
MARILLLETSEEIAGIVTDTLSRLGHEVVVVGTSQRMRLELRAGPASLLIAAMDLKHGSGLDLVRDACAEASEPIPVLVLSRTASAEDIARDAPVDLLVEGVLGSPPDPLRLARFVGAVIPGSDRDAAVRVMGELARESAGGRDREGMPAKPTPLGLKTVAHLLARADRLGWTGCLRVSPQGGDSVDCWMAEGLLAGVSVEGQGALLKTAQLSGQLDAAKVPDVVFNNEEEEVGLLLALRAVAMHQVDQLREQTRDRLLNEVLSCAAGTLHCLPGGEPVSRLGAPRPVLSVLMEGRRGGVLRSGSGQGRRDSPLWLSLPAKRSVRVTKQNDEDARLLARLTGPGCEGSSFGEVVDAAIAEGAEGEDVVASLSFLRELGYLDFVPTLFDEETSSRLHSMIQELHRQHGADHYQVLGLQPTASDKDLKHAMRQLSRLYHPDSLFGVHPRVVATAAEVYGRVQEAYEVLGDADQRREYLDARRSSGGEEGAGARDRDRGKVSLAQARILMKNKKYERAREAYRDATLHDEHSFEARLMLGWSRFLADHADHEQAFADLEQARGMGVNPGEALYYMGRVRLLQKDFAGARKWFEKAAAASLNGHANATRELRLMDQRGQGVADESGEDDQAKPRGFFSRLRRN